MKTLLICLTLATCCACAKDNTSDRDHTTAAATHSSGTVMAGDHAPSKTTAMDQTNNKADLTLVQDVRKALMDTSSFSTAAKNLTTVARDGTVTVKGEVPTQEEKEQVEACILKVTGVQRVENQITVKPN